MQVFVSELQNALRPQFFPPQASTHRPVSQIWFLPGHGLLTEHTTGEQVPPGNGFPIIPSLQTHTGPSGDTIHWPFCPQAIFWHSDIHFPFVSSLNPLLHLHHAAWASGTHIAFSPQGRLEQGLIHRFDSHVSCPGQSSSDEHSTLPWGRLPEQPPT